MARDGARTRAWKDGKLLEEGFPAAQISDYLEQDGTMVWLDLCSPDSDDLHVITEELGLDAVAVEDAVSPRERARLDRYPDYMFLNVYSPVLDGTDLELRELSAFVTRRALVTIRAEHGFDMDALVERWDADADLAGNGVAYLLHALVDLVVDQDFEVIQQFDAEVDDLETLLFDGDAPMREIQERSFRLRKNLVDLRRVTLPMREILNTLMRRDLKIVDTAMGPYYQDVYDHTLRAIEWSESLRELIANLMETRLAMQSNRLNEVMKKVTSWAAIIAVPTAVTGFYGQNVPYPGSGTHWGFVVSSVIILTLSVSLYVVFKVRDWL